MTKILNNNSNPSGYDSRYHTAHHNVAYRDVINISESKAIINDEVEKLKKNVVVYVQQSQLESKQEYKDERTTEYIKTEYVENLSDISKLKVSFIVKIIKRKLTVLHRVKNHRLLKDKIIPDSLIIEREIEKRATLNIVDMLAILNFTDKNKEMTTQQKVLLMSELNKNVKLTVDEKIAIVTRIIKSNIVVDPDSCKHLKNKLTLLFIVKESGFSIDVTRVKGYKPVMNEVEEAEIENNQPAEAKLVSELTTDDISEDTSPQTNEADTHEMIESDEAQEVLPVQDSIESIDVAENSTNAVTKVKVKSKAKVKQKAPAEKPKITKTFVNSKRHFKFGAGYIAKNKVLTILLPSGYILTENSVYQSNALRNGIISKTNALNSPLCITFTKAVEPSEYTLVDFYNSNLIECRDNRLKYRNTVISRMPAVLKHKPNSNVYTASVFIKEAKLVYDVKFTFKKNVANTASTVNRILASILFEGM